ncbi:aspartic peptidase domain-containing protein [Gautieria morchelliformis]|nr:aspartic peptidase domain-containing protein [Gautieria morchelliformis]
MRFSRLFPAVLLIASAVASPLSIRRNGPIEPHSLETLVKINVAGGMKNVISNDRARLQALFLSRKNSAGPASGGSNKPIFASGNVMNSPSSSNGVSVPVPVIESGNLDQPGQDASALVGVSIPLTVNTESSDFIIPSFSLASGTPDTTKFNGDLTFVPITTTFPSSQFWGIDQSITYGNTKLPILSTTSGIVDTGTTLLYMATDAFNAYVSATGATVDPTTGLLTIKNPANLQSLFFNMGGNTFEFTANAQIFPHSLNTQIGGNSGSTYLIVQDIGTNSGQGLDFINGVTFLQRFYSVFDTPNQRVGFATTPQTTATSN